MQRVVLHFVSLAPLLIIAVQHISRNETYLSGACDFYYLVGLSAPNWNAAVSANSPTSVLRLIFKILFKFQSQDSYFMTVSLNILEIN